MRTCGTNALEDARIYIPQSKSRGSYESRVRRAVRWLWSRGIYPGPQAVGLRVHGRDRRDLNDREIKWRRAEMEAIGIPRQRAESSWHRRVFNPDGGEKGGE